MRRLVVSCILLAMSALLASSIQAYPQADSGTRPDPHQDGTAGLITDLAVPERFVIIVQKSEHRRTLHRRGDILVHAQDGTRAVAVERVEPNRAVMRESAAGKRITLKPGDPIPGWDGYMFAGTVVLDRLEYHLKSVETLRHEEPVVLDIAGGRAVLEQEVLGGTTRAAQPIVKHQPSPDPQRRGPPARRLPAREVARDVYEVPEAVVRPVIAKAGEVLSEIRPKFTPIYMVQAATARDFTSQLGDVALTEQGFEVTRPGIARRFGIEVGDRVLGLNGRPVTSPLNAWWTYQELFVRNRNMTEVRVDIARKGRVVTKTFRIR